MTMDPTAAAHIMSIMTNMYADPEAAVVREYSTNAWDSHVAAGQTRPIEVTTPSELRPMLTIKDYGLGLDAEDIRVTVSRYGASTKRGSNDANGMLGIGCKSALAYTDQFTITGVKGGTLTTVSVSRGADGAGTMTTLDARETDEPNGVEIAIPVSPGNAVAAKVAQFFSYWTPGTALVDGEEPAAVEGTEIGECVIEPRGGSYAAHVVVMGNVAYPLPMNYQHDALRDVSGKRRLVISVPIGALGFAPSREALLDNAETRATLDGTLDAFMVALRAHINGKLKDASTRAEALREVSGFAEIMRVLPEGLRWRDQLIPIKVATLPVHGPRPQGERNSTLDRKVIYRTYGTSRGGAGRQETGSVPALEAIDGFWVCNYTNKSWSAPMRLKLEAYLAERGEDKPAEVYLTDDVRPPGGDWMDEARRVDWEAVRDWRDPDTAITREKGPLSYPAYYFSIAEGGELAGPYRKDSYPAGDLPDASQGGLYYYVGSKNDPTGRIGATVIGKQNAGAVIVLLQANRAAKFKRLYPHAVRMQDATQTAAREWWKALTREQREVTLENTATPGFSSLALIAEKVGPLKDPLFKRLARLKKAYNRDTFFAYRDTYSPLLTEKDRGELPGVAKTLETRYPLIGHVGAFNLRHGDGSVAEGLKIYIDAAFAARKDGE